MTQEQIKTVDLKADGERYTKRCMEISSDKLYCNWARNTDFDF